MLLHLQFCIYYYGNQNTFYSASLIIYNCICQFKLIVSVYIRLKRIILRYIVLDADQLSQLN